MMQQHFFHHDYRYQISDREIRLKLRAGSTLLVVLVVVVMLSLGAYTFSELMIVEMEAANIYGRSLQSRELALSGIEQAAVYVGDRSEIDGWNSYHNPEQFQNINLVPGETSRTSGYFSVVAPVVTDSESKSIRFGLMNESGKLNLNILATEEVDDLEDVDSELDEFDIEADTPVDRLMYIPNMTEDIAAAILDWIDEDDETRSLGAESDYYETLESPYSAKNAPLESLDELLLVRGVTPELLYGEDTNRNGILDPNENDGDATLPLDNADGVLDPGWSAFFTVHSREINIRPDGSEKINLNATMLTELYDELEAELGPDEARFIVAYRTSGPVPTLSDLESGGVVTAVGGETSEREALNELAVGIAKAIFSEEGVTVTRAGIDLSAGGIYRIDSIYDLIGSEVETEIDGKQTKLVSPWSADPAAMTADLPILHDLLTTTKSQYIEGRIDIGQARLETLLGIPEMDEDLANSIVNSQMTGTNGAPSTEISQARQTTGWLVIEGLTTIEQMRKLAPYINSGGDVFRAQSLGYYGKGGPVTRVEAIIDGTFIPPRITYVRDLSNLGAGYPLSSFRGNETRWLGETTQ